MSALAIIVTDIRLGCIAWLGSVLFFYIWLNVRLHQHINKPFIVFPMLLKNLNFLILPFYILLGTLFCLLEFLGVARLLPFKRTSKVFNFVYKKIGLGLGCTGSIKYGDYPGESGHYGEEIWKRHTHGFDLPNAQTEPRSWLARSVLLGAQSVTAMIVGSSALLGSVFILIELVEVPIP